MEQSLDADGCRIVRTFFSTLLHSRKQYGKFDMTTVMKEYVKIKTGPKKYNTAHRTWTPDKIEIIKSMLDKGAKTSEIADYFNVSQMNISQAINRWEGIGIKEYKRGRLCS